MLKSFSADPTSVTKVFSPCVNLHVGATNGGGRPKVGIDLDCLNNVSLPGSITVCCSKALCDLIAFKAA